MLEFRPLPNRDAWPTIRGYVYQVDHSILRWLDLQPSEILELERGEDIDLVLPGFAESEDELLRRLEQVKHRDGTLTLRSPEALTSVANYHAYRTAETAVRLSFCFTTNAHAGREKPSPMPNRMPALERWNALRTGAVAPAERPATINGIRQIVTYANRPDDVSPEHWQAASNFFKTATDEELLRFIRDFEWSLGAGEASDLAVQIRERLLADDVVSNQAAAQSMYERLFLFVFKALTQRGVKRLTRDALIEQLAQPTLSADELRLLSNLTARMHDIEQRVLAVEGTLVEHDVLITRVSTELERLVSPTGQLGMIRYAAEIPLLDIPPLAERASQRTETVAHLIDTAAPGSWLALFGGVGMGKTQLSVLLARQLEVKTIWLTLRGVSPDVAGEQLDAGLATATSATISTPRTGWYRQVCEGLGVGSLIVLDDLPRFGPADGLGKRLTLLAPAVAAGQVRLLTTSVYPLSASTRALIASVNLREIPAPPFTDAEATDLLLTYGAPDWLLKAKATSFLNDTARRHPTLLDAMARFLADRNWMVIDETFEALIKRTFATDVNDETMRYLLATVEDGDSRELLYRLTLIPHPFAVDDVQALATVPTVVPRPRERLDALSGLWVQREAGQRYAVSPLVATFGSDELSPDTAHGCHRVLGERIVAQGKMTPLQIVEAIGHFQAAEDYHRSGALFAWSLSELNTHEATTPDYGLLSAWEDGSMPLGIPLGLRMYARALQVAGRIRRTMSVDTVLADLDTLVEQATAAEAWAVIAVSVVLGGQLDADRAIRFLRLAFRLAPSGLAPDGSPLSLPEQLRYEQMIWAVVPALETSSQVDEWLSMIDAMSPTQRAHALQDEHLTEDGAFALAEQVWLRESDKPAEQRDWPGALRLLEDLAQRARALDMEVLWAGAVRAEVIIRAEYDGALESAVRTTETALAQASADPRVHFLLRECLGRQYLYDGQAGVAAEWLTAALAYETEAFPRVRMFALFSLSRAVLSAADGAPALQYAQRAVDLARASDGISETDVVRALSELAIVQWKVNGVAAAFAAWDEAGEQLMSCRSESEVWQDLFVVYGHISGYFVALATTGAPPTLASGVELYTAPTPGMLLINRTDRASRYQPERDAYLMAQLAMYAEEVGNDERAAAWAARGLELARTTRQWLALSQLGLTLLQRLALADRYDDVLETARECGALTVALGTLRTSGKRPEAQVGEYEELLSSALGQRTNPQWQQAEELGLFLGLVPVTFRLATISLENPVRAAAAATTVAALCREIAASAADAQVWLNGADYIERTFVAEASARDLLELAVQLGDDGASGLRVILRLGASLLVRGNPRLALQIHQGLIPYLRQMLSTTPGMYRRVVTPFVIAFWNGRLTEQRVYFRMPNLIESEVNEAIAHPDRDLAQRVLAAVAPGLL